MVSVVHAVAGYFEVGKLARAYYTFIVLVSLPWEEKDKQQRRASLGSQEE